VSAILIAMTGNKKTQKNVNKEIKMNGIVVSEVVHNKTKYMLVKVIIPSNDNHFIVLTEYDNMLTVKATGLYAEDAIDNAVKRAYDRGDDDEVERYYLLLGKFSLDRWNGVKQ